MDGFKDSSCACRSLAECGDFDGILFTQHDTRCAARLRPLLERCLTEAQVAYATTRAPRTERLILDIRRELGKPPALDPQGIITSGTCPQCHASAGYAHKMSCSHGEGKGLRFAADRELGKEG